MKPSSDIVTLKNTFPAISAPSPPARSPAQSWSRRAVAGPRTVDRSRATLGDVDRQVAQCLLAALDRVVLLHGLLAEFLGGEHRAHHDPGLRAGRLEGQDRLEGIRVVAGLAVQQRDPLRRDDLPPGDPLLVVGPVRPVHDEVPLPADAEVEGPSRGGEALRSPPPRQVPDSRERLEHQLTRGTDHPGDHDLAVRGRVCSLAAATGRRHRVVPPALPASTPARTRPAGRSSRSRTARSRPPTRGPAAARGRPGRTAAACPPRGPARARPPGGPAGAWTPAAGSSPGPAPGRSPAARRPAAAPGSPAAAARRSR